MISITPDTLIATCSVLIDLTFRRELYRDRIWTQIILWLTLSLQETQSSQALLLHGIFALSIISCTYAVLLLRWSYFLGASDYTRLLAPSLLITLFCDSFFRQSETVRSNNGWIIFPCTFAGLAAWVWYSNQRFQQRQSLVGMPIVTSTVNLTSVNLDEFHWNQWTRSQVLHWISSLDDEWRYSVCRVLAPEGITGSVLKGMTADDLRSMGISYGDARRLVDQIHLLTSKYPDRNLSSDSGGEQRDLFQDWLGDDVAATTTYIHQVPKSFMNEDVDLNEDVVAQAKAVMKERFGFELPDLRNNTSIETESGAAGTSQVSEGVEGTMPSVEDITDVFAEEESSHLLIPPPPELLSSLPDHIRDIAIRKPELLTALWTTHQLQSKNRNAPDPDRIKRLIQESIPVRFDAVETIIPNVHHDEEETTALLRKRTSNPKYASIS